MNDLGTKRIETERLILRKFDISDVSEVFHGWVSDEKVTKYLSWNAHKNIQETTNIVENWINQYDSNSYNWVVELKHTHELIGNISVISISRKHQNCEIGYCYGSKHWNQGYATEALKTVIDYLLYDCEMHVVEAKHHSINPASGRVMEKAGMIKEAVLKERRYHPEMDSYCDLVCYYITK